MKKNKTPKAPGKPTVGLESAEGPEEYQVKDAADTLMKAEKIKADGDLMPHVHKHMESMKQHINSVQQLKDYRNKMAAIEREKLENE